MQITKGLAEEIAFKMTQNLRDKKQVLEKQQSEIIYGYAIAEIPKEVMAMFKSKNKSYIQSHSYVRLIGNGFNHDHVNCEQYPTNKNSTSFLVSAELAEKLNPLKNAIADYEKEIKVLQKNIEEAIFNLRTKKKVSEQFPEALSFFPEEKAKNTAIMVDLTKLRDFAKNVVLEKVA